MTDIAPHACRNDFRLGRGIVVNYFISKNIALTPAAKQINANINISNPLISIIIFSFKLRHSRSSHAKYQLLSSLTFRIVSTVGFSLHP